MPAVLEYQDQLAETIKTVESVTKTKATQQRKLLGQIVKLAELSLSLADKLDVAIKKGDAVKIKAAMDKVRKPIDELEGLVPQDLWPVPSYAEMLFMH